MNFKKKLAQLTNQRVLILGLGAEGWSTYEFLHKYLPKLELTIADQRPLEEFSQDQQAKLTKNKRLTLQLGPNYLENLDQFDLIFKAPGIPKSLPKIDQAINKGTQLGSNTQLFFELCQAKIIGITGTKGKSTTTAVIHHVLKEGGQPTALVGNIGLPALSSLKDIKPDTWVVFELSSHQLETLNVSPQIAVIQDITSEHLDYYATTKEYQQAKSAIARFQRRQDIVIYNPEFKVTAQIASLSPGKHLHHTLAEQPNSRAFIRNEEVCYRGQSGQVTALLPTIDLPLPGQHNLYNILPAVIIGRQANIPFEKITASLKSFRSLPHRLELVSQTNNVKYYDDSLATNPFATSKALESFSQPTVLIAGGYERDQDFTDLAQTILNQPVTGLVLFNPTGKRLEKAIKKAAKKNQKLPEIQFTESMPEAVKKARALVPKSGGIILLSPASASFGMFKDYRDRGLQFQKAVKEIS